MFPKNLEVVHFFFALKGRNTECLKTERSFVPRGSNGVIDSAKNIQFPAIGVSSGAMVSRYTRALSGELAVEEFQRSWGQLASSYE